MGLKGVLFFLSSLIFILAQGCLCRASREDRLNDALEKIHKNVYGQHTVLISLLSEKVNVLACPSNQQQTLENVLLYKGLSSPDESVEFCFRKHYEKNLEYYWKKDVGKIALKIILATDNNALFDVLMNSSHIKQSVQNTDLGRALIAQYGRDTILAKYFS